MLLASYKFMQILFCNKTFNLVLKKERRYIIAIFFNVCFSLLASYLLYFTFSKFTYKEYQHLTILITIFFLLIVFSEFFNIINCNAVNNIFSQKTIEIFPISQPKLFLQKYLNDCINLRCLLYIFPLAVILYYSFLFNPTALPYIIVLFVLLYLTVSLIYSGIDYLYGLIKYRLGNLTEKIIMITLISITILITLTGINPHLSLNINRFIFQLIKLVIPVNG